MAPQIELASMAAWPAIRSEEYDNWVLRFAGGQTRRSNSVNIVGPSSLPLDEKIAYCEQAYASEGIRLVFKFAPIPWTKPLKRRLATLGYLYEGETNVMTLSLSRQVGEAKHKVELEAELSSKWLEAALSLGEVDPKRHGHMEGILRAIPSTRAFASVSVDGQVAAIGIAVAVEDHVGIFDIATALEYRRQRMASSVMAEALDWGKKQGAKTAFLQVMEGNDGAREMYRGLGFKERYKYWYRARPLA